MFLLFYLFPENFELPGSMSLRLRTTIRDEQFGSFFGLKISMTVEYFHSIEK